VGGVRREQGGRPDDRQTLTGSACAAGRRRMCATSAHRPARIRPRATGYLRNAPSDGFEMRRMRLPRRLRSTCPPRPPTRSTRVSDECKPEADSEASGVARSSRCGSSRVASWGRPMTRTMSDAHAMVAEGPLSMTRAARMTSSACVDLKIVCCASAGAGSAGSVMDCQRTGPLPYPPIVREYEDGVPCSNRCCRPLRSPHPT
jgi:hypothetical protein